MTGNHAVTRRSRICLPAVLAICLAVTGGCSRDPEAKRLSYMQAGKDFLNSKDYQRAVLEFKNALSLKPLDAEAQYQLGLAYLATGDWSLAANHLKRATELSPEHSQAQVRFSEMLSTTSDPALLEEARKRLQNVFQASPGNTEALTALAITEWKLADRGAAEKHLQEAFHKSGNLSPAVALARIHIQQNQWEDAEKVLKTALDQKPSALAMVVLGEFYLLRGRNAEAESLFTKALGMDHDHSLALQHLAAMHVRAGKTDEAGHLYRRLAALPSESYQSAHATFLLQTGKKEEALAEFRKLAERHKDKSEFRTQLVTALILSDRLSEAEKVLLDALKKNPSDVQALLQSGALYLTLERYSDAERDLNRVLYVRPKSAEGKYLFSKLYEARGHILSQRQALDEALQWNPEFAAARVDLAMLLIRRNAAKTALQLMEETPNSQKRLVAIVLQRNWALAALGRWNEVEQSLAGELKGMPGPEVAVLAAILRLEQGKRDEARQMARKALEGGTDDIRALEIIARSYQMENNIDAAVREIAGYAGRHANNAPVQSFLGDLLLSMGLREQARATFHQARLLRPGYSTAELSLVKMDITDGKLDQAEQSLGKLLTEKGENVTARVWMGTLNEIRGKNDLAIEHYRKALQLDPNQVQALNNLAYLLAESAKQPDQALRFAEKAAELAPDNASVRNTLGWVFYHKGMYNIAVRHLERAVEAESTPMRNFHLAMAYWKNGDRARAQRVYKAAALLQPESREAQEARQLLAQ